MSLWCHRPSFMVWSAGHRKELNRVIKEASSALGCPPHPVEVVIVGWWLLENTSHPMQLHQRRAAGPAGCGGGPRAHSGG